MPSILYQFNGVNLRTATGIAGVTCTLNQEGIDSPADLAEQEIPRRQGSVVQAARKKSRIIKLVGELGGSVTADNLQTAIDTLKAACMGLTGPQRLFAGRDDRYWLAQCESFSDDYAGGKLYGTIANVTIQFRAADPDAYGASAGTPITTGPVSLTVGSSTNVTPGGDSCAHPIWSLTMGAGTGNISLANALSGETVIVSGTFANADIITLNAPEGSYGAYKNSALNYGLFSGAIPRLWPGVNAITLLVQLIQTATITGTPTGGTFTLTWNGHTTSGLAFNASASAVQTALAALSGIGAGNVTVTGANGGPYTITLAMALGNANAITASGAGLTGGASPGVTMATTSPTVSAASATYQPRWC